GGEIVLAEAVAEFAGMDADGRVDAGVIAGVAVEDVEAYGVFLEFSGPAGEGRLDEVAKEPTQALRAGEGGTGKDGIQFGADRIRSVRRHRGGPGIGHGVYLN